MKRGVWLLLATLLTAASGCGEQPQSAADYTECSTPRPQMCTREYQPVCAALDTGVRCVTEPCPSQTRKTYGNACDACADQAVTGYSAGACESQESG